MAKNRRPSGDTDYVGMMACYYCGEEYGVALHKRLKKVLPRSAVYDRNPCPKCEEAMKQGIILIEARAWDGKGEPYRTGQIWGISEEFARKVFDHMPEEWKKAVLDELRFTYVEEGVGERLGLPRGEYDPQGIYGEPATGEKTP